MQIKKNMSLMFECLILKRTNDICVKVGVSACFEMGHLLA